MSGKLGLAVIGTGMAALPHAKALRDLSDQIEVRGVFSRNEEIRREFCSKWGFPPADSLDALTGDERVNAALLITPPNARVELVEAFAAEGKHILMEKPIERSTAAARGIVERCEQCGVSLAIVFQHRYRAASKRLQELVEAGELGEMHTLEMRIPWWRDQSYYDEPGRGSYERDGGGVLISQAIHSLDLMLSLAGPVEEVQAMATTTSLHKMEAEDFVAGAMRFSSGAIGSLMATTATFPGAPEELRICFEQANTHLAAGVLTVNWRNGRSETVGEPAATGGGSDPMAFPHEWHRDLIADFSNALREGRTPTTNGRSALTVHLLIDALLESSRLKKAIAVEQNDG